MIFLKWWNIFSEWTVFGMCLGFEITSKNVSPSEKPVYFTVLQPHYYPQRPECESEIMMWCSVLWPNKINTKPSSVFCFKLRLGWFHTSITQLPLRLQSSVAITAHLLARWRDVHSTTQSRAYHYFLMSLQPWSEINCQTNTRTKWLIVITKWDGFAIYGASEIMMFYRVKAGKQGPGIKL